MVKQGFTSWNLATWVNALNNCTSKKHYSVIQNAIILIYVDENNLFHPIHAILSNNSNREPFVCMMRIHPQITHLLDEMEQKGMEVETLIDSFLFKDNSGTICGTNTLPNHFRNVLPFFSGKTLRLSDGSLLPCVEEESEAKIILSKVITASYELSSGLLLPSVLVSHRYGYIGYQHDRTRGGYVILRLTTEVTEAAKTQSLDHLIEEYEHEFRLMNEMNDHNENNPEIKINVRAGFDLWGLGSIFNSSTFSERSNLQLLASWNGIENVRHLLSKPPPHSSSVLCFQPESKGVITSQFLPKVFGSNASLLRNIDKSRVDPSHQWPFDSVYKTCSTGITAAQYLEEDQHLIQKFQSFLNNGESATLTSNGNENNTLDFTLSITRDVHLNLDLGNTADALVPRSDLDFLERFWDFVAFYVKSVEQVMLILRELIKYIAVNGLSSPEIHPTNHTLLAQCLRDPTMLQAIQRKMAGPGDALDCLKELGIWKMSRDFHFWLTTIGFSFMESQSLLEKMNFVSANTHDGIDTLEQILGLCALTSSFGLTTSMIRKALTDCVTYYHDMEHPRHDVKSPTYFIPLSSFLPEKVRSNLAEPFLWDVSMSFASNFERCIRLCPASFVGFKQEQIENEGEEHDQVLLGNDVLEKWQALLPSEILEKDYAKQFFSMELQIKKKAIQEKQNLQLVQMICTTRSVSWLHP